MDIYYTLSGYTVYRYDNHYKTSYSVSSEDSGMSVRSTIESLKNPGEIFSIQRMTKTLLQD